MPRRQRMGPLQKMVQRQVDRVLTRGQRFAKFDQIRQRHFWSTYLFAPGGGNPIAAGPYDLFQTIASAAGQGYPTNVPLTLRETNWLNQGRVPDNQNFAISEIGVSINRPPSVNGSPPSDSIYANLPAPVQALVAPTAPIHPRDAANILYGTVLEMRFLTNAVPIGLCADFSQSAGTVAFESAAQGAGTPPVDNEGGDPRNGVPAAAFRRKLEVPILLQHGETMGMRLNVHRAIPTLAPTAGGTGWFEVRVDWWATESFVEKS